MRRIVVLLSGGLDSGVTLAHVLNLGYDKKDVFTLGFLYGQRHLKEVTIARGLANFYGVNYKTCQLTFPLTNRPLISNTGDLNEKVNDLPASFVPGRNIVFIGLAAGYAYELGADTIAGGWNFTDYPGYPDCRPDFLNDMETAISSGLEKNVHILAPLLYLTKTQIVVKGQVHRLPFDLTWSCYQGGDAPCGECSSCRYRAEGFVKAGVVDTLVK